MRPSRLASPRGLVLLFLLFLLVCCSVFGRETRLSTPSRSRRSQQGSKHKGAHHRQLTDEQKDDQNLQFMLSLYRSAAGPDGRPKQHRKFGSNTVRLLKPTESSVRYLPASRDHHYTFTVQYNLDTLPTEQLIKASFVHLRSSSPSSSAAPPPESPRCQAQITSLGLESLVTLEPHERWTETDITAHVSRHVLRGRDTRRLTLTAQYWCSDPGREEDKSTDSGWRWWSSFFSRRQVERLQEPHLEVPSLLLYLEEEREGNDWMGELLGGEGKDFETTLERWLPSVRRRRRSKDSSENNLSLDALKKAPTSTSSFSTSPSASIISDMPNYKRKTGLPNNRCKLHNFRLSFDELGWGHYFIAPPVYNPRFCQGDCPRVLHYGYHSPNHAIIQTVINELGLGEVPPPSCVPYKYMPMSVLVVHKKKVEYRELEDMVAESCTCR